jgi:hypothetical protein
MNLRDLTVFLVFSTALCLFGATPQKETIIEYGQFNGRPVQMVLEPKGHIVLKVTLLSAAEGGDSLDGGDSMDVDYAIHFLEKELARLTSTTKPVALGKSGYSFTYEGGYPIWGPHQEVSKGVSHECLFFAENAKIIGHEIRGKGTERPFARPIRTNMSNPACDDREKTLASVPHDVLVSLENALIKSDVEEVKRIIASHPELGLKAFLSMPRGKIESYTIVNHEGCMVIMRRSSMGY